jgi:hypothetical protein
VERLEQVEELFKKSQYWIRPDTDVTVPIKVCARRKNLTLLRKTRFQFEQVLGN